MNATLRIHICSHLRARGRRGTRMDSAGCMIGSSRRLARNIRDVIPEKWSGRADAVGNAGTFQCGIHHQHLRSLNVRHETERSRHDWKHPPKRDLTPKPKRRLQLAAAVQTFKIFLKTEKLVLFCQINLNKSIAFLRKLYPRKWTRK